MLALDTAVDDFKKRFPKLAEEIEQNKMRVEIGPARSEDKRGDGNRPLNGYAPDVVDFLRRCDTADEATQIITFLEKRGEIPRDHARKLLVQLRKRGLRSFGPKKEHDDYFRQETG